MKNSTSIPSASGNNLQQATFAGGCFWCVEHPYDELPGVISAVSGYAGGNVKNPTYEMVSNGTTGHLEAVQITFDPSQISYNTLLENFWRQIDPTDDGGQFADRGSQYQTAIFYHDEEQKRIAEESKKALETSGKYDVPLVTAIRPFTTFFPAEEYHQQYAEKNPTQYEEYREGSGRADYIKSMWGDAPSVSETCSTADFSRPPDANLRTMLTPEQWEVTQEEGTERPFENEYWDNKEEGLYVDRVSGEPLFSSKEKYDSKTGWPSFWDTIAPENIVEKQDQRLFTTRTEVRSRIGDSHLGHVFPDGPQPSGLRYCMNSAALRFIPKEQLEEEGYGEYVKLFEE